MRILWTLLVSACGLLAATSVSAHSCVLPDNGTGTIDLPPECPDGYQGHMAIIDGLPAGSTIEIEATLNDYENIVRTPGGSLGGEILEFDARLYWVAVGTGDLTGFNRNLAIPVSCEIHTAPRTPGDPVQIFACDFFSLTGQLFGDPDFCELIVVAGTDNGLPSPGQTTLTEVPSGDYAVDSFFDITYQIQFEGCPDSQMLGDLAGTTIGTDRFQAGERYTVGVAESLGYAHSFRLNQNVPNPFNPITAIQYDVPAGGGKIDLCVYDLRGRLVRTLVNAYQTAGRRLVTWDGRNEYGHQVASGVYVYVLRTDGGKSCRKMAIAK